MLLFPEAQSVLKRKKQFSKGRAITSYAGSLRSKLLQLASIVLSLMAKTLYPDSPGMQSRPQLWQPCIDTVNAVPRKDIPRIFNAVPRKDIPQAVTAITQDIKTKLGAKVCQLTCSRRLGTRAIPEGGYNPT